MVDTKAGRTSSARWPRRSSPWVAVVVAWVVMAPRAGAQEATAPGPQPAAEQVAPLPQYAEPVTLAEKQAAPKRFMLGVSIGKGAGLFGASLSFRPTDRFGFEVNVGKRMFVIENAYAGTTEVFWPTAVAGKVQLYFGRPEARFQHGVEAGLLYAADAGGGGEVAYYGRLRVGRSLFFDFNLGVASYPDIEARQVEYAVENTNETAAYYESELEPTPVILMWGLGFGVMF